jgi:hypothetical protein
MDSEWVILLGSRVTVFLLVVPVRCTRSIGDPGGVLAALREKIVMANLATNTDKIGKVFVVLTRAMRVTRFLRLSGSTHSRHATLEVQLHVKAVTDALDLVQAVTDVVEFRAKGFISGICILEICRQRECLRVLE